MKMNLPKSKSTRVKAKSTATKQKLEPVRLTLSLQRNLYRKFKRIGEQMGIEPTAAVRFFALYGLQQSPLLPLINNMEKDEDEDNEEEEDE